MRLSGLCSIGQFFCYSLPIGIHHTALKDKWFEVSPFHVLHPSALLKDKWFEVSPFHVLHPSSLESEQYLVAWVAYLAAKHRNRLARRLFPEQLQWEAGARAQDPFANVSRGHFFEFVSKHAWCPCAILLKLNHLFVFMEHIFSFWWVCVHSSNLPGTAAPCRYVYINWCGVGYLHLSHPFFYLYTMTKNRL